MNEKNVLVMGSGGRESAICVSLAPHYKKVFALPGNLGMEKFAQIVSGIGINDFWAIADFCKQQNITRIIVGPGELLLRGIVDYFQKNKLVEVVGPMKSVSWFESTNDCSRIFANKYDIPTAIKRKGYEMSVVVAVDETGAFVVLPTVKGYKKLADGDTGLVTVGMGAVAPVLVKNGLMEKIIHKIIEPTIAGARDSGSPYTGFLTMDLIVAGGEPYLFKYNCCLGDPETQTIVPLINNFPDLIEAMVTNTLGSFKLDVKKGFSVAVVLAAKGYPGLPEKGKQICFTGEMVHHNCDHIENVNVFMAGVLRENDGIYYTNSGRVLTVQALCDDSLEHAINLVYSAVETVYFEDCFHRNDIGRDLLASVPA